MSVSDTQHLSALDAILYDRPAGRNIIDFAREEIEKLRAVQEAQQRELVLRAHNQTRHLEEVQKLRGEIDALQRLVQREQAEVYRLSTVFVKPGEHE